MYLENFKKAIERTEELGLSVPNVEYNGKRYLDSKFLNDLPLLLYRELGAIDHNDLYKNCMAIHYQLKPIFEKIFNIEIYFTLGNAKVNDTYLFKIEESEIIDLLENKVKKPINIHAWLTLPSMEILDFSLVTTYCITNKVQEGMGGVITKHYSELTLGMMYEPMLIGDDFLRKSGGLIETY